MSIINDRLLSESEKYISALFSEKTHENLIYHDLVHTLRLKEYAEEIGKHEGLSSEEMEILKLSALFHDAGYLNSYKDHAKESVSLVSSFLSDHGVEGKIIDHICDVIRSCQLPHGPKDRVAEVLCDACMAFITAENGLEELDLMHDEMAMNKVVGSKPQSFEKDYVKFLAQHTYFTEYGRKVLQPKKEAVMKRLSDRLKRRKKIENINIGQKGIFYSRGVETMFRITARNQINLNSIADNKSNILISVNAIIISIIITMLAGNIANLSHNIVPVLVFLVSCLVTIIIAILSTRPNIVTTKFSNDDLKNKKVDLIFFGNFEKMDYDEYLDALKELMKDDDHLYATLIKNQYSLGKILSKKFRLVRIAYNVFMTGIIITVVVFLLNYLFMASLA